MSFMWCWLCDHRKFEEVTTIANRGCCPEKIITNQGAWYKEFKEHFESVQRMCIAVLRTDSSISTQLTKQCFVVENTPGHGSEKENCAPSLNLWRKMLLCWERYTRGKKSSAEKISVSFNLKCKEIMSKWQVSWWKLQMRAGAVAQWWRPCLACARLWFQSPVPQKKVTNEYDVLYKQKTVCLCYCFEGVLSSRVEKPSIWVRAFSSLGFLNPK
jgi:hypothetical protein